MTNFGVFGTILSIDEEENQVLLETSPGTVLTVHRQTDRPRRRARRGQRRRPRSLRPTPTASPSTASASTTRPTDEAPDTKKSDD